ncbi:MAG: 50S ribosomal protein L30e [Methanosarcinales archaeon]
MKMDLNKEIRTAIRTGEVHIGSNKTIAAVKNRKAKIVVIASNCPKDIRQKIESGRAHIINYPGKSIELGHALGYTFTIASLAIINAGDSDIANYPRRIAEAGNS